MVLADLGRRLNSALADLSKVPTVNDAAIDSLLRSVATALLESDVNVKLVSKLRDDVRKQVKESLNDPKNEKMNQAQRRSLVQRAIYDHLVALVDPGVEPYKPKKGKPNVIMFVGLQGSGKTTSCTKLALYYQKRGFKTGLVCADTFRAGAFDQLKQNATKANIPFYGSYSEPDPVSIAKTGVANFKASRFDIIIVDTSGRHKQELELFNEMMEIQEAVKPDQTIMVLDASIGQAAEGQSKAFKDAASFGAIFVTKIDGHAKGGGAISAVAATKTPIIFLGVGEHVADLESFKAGPFISKLLGMGDLSGLMEMGEEFAASAGGEKQKEMLEKLQKGGNFSIGDWREQVGNLMSMGPLSKMMGMIPGLGQMLGGGQGDEIQSKMKHFIFITDSMTKFELDSDGSCFSAPIKDHLSSKKSSRNKPSQAAMVLAQPADAADEEESNGKGKKKEKPPMRMTARAYRVAKGSGTSIADVENMLVMYRMMRKVMKGMGGKNGMLSQMQAMQNSGKPGQVPPNMSPEQMRQVKAAQDNLPPEIKARLRQPGGREKLMKEMAEGKIPPGMEGMTGGIPGLGGGGLGGLGGLMQGLMGGGGGGGGGGMAGLQQMMQGAMGGAGGNAGAGGMPDMSQMAEMMKQFGMGGGPK